jgi:hypothetical protein
MEADLELLGDDDELDAVAFGTAEKSEWAGTKRRDTACRFETTLLRPCRLELSARESRVLIVDLRSEQNGKEFKTRF